MQVSPRACVFFWSHSTRLETRTKESNRWAIFFLVGAKPASALKAPAWTSAQATDCHLKSRLRKSTSVWGLSLPSLSSLSLFSHSAFFPRCVQHATPSTHATQSTCVIIIIIIIIIFIFIIFMILRRLYSSCRACAPRTHGRRKVSVYVPVLSKTLEGFHVPQCFQVDGTEELVVCR